MKIALLTGVVFAGLAIAASAQPIQFYKADGRAVISGGSLNPADPSEGCDRAKQDARNKAASAGYGGHADWSHLSNDSDCRLETSRAGSVGYFFIFTASGTFYQ